MIITIDPDLFKIKSEYLNSFSKIIESDSFIKTGIAAESDEEYRSLTSKNLCFYDFVERNMDEIEKRIAERMPKSAIIVFYNYDFEKLKDSKEVRFLRKSAEKIVFAKPNGKKKQFFKMRYTCGGSESCLIDNELKNMINLLLA